MHVALVIATRLRGLFPVVVLNRFVGVRAVLQVRQESPPVLEHVEEQLPPPPLPFLFVLAH